MSSAAIDESMPLKTEANVVLAKKTLEIIRVMELADHLIKVKFDNNSKWWLDAMFRVLMLRNNEYVWQERSTRFETQEICQKLCENFSQAYSEMGASKQNMNEYQSKSCSDFILASNSFIRVFSELTNLLIRDNAPVIDVSGVLEEMKSIVKNTTKLISLYETLKKEGASTVPTGCMELSSSIPTLPSKTLASSSTEVHDILRSNSDATDDTEKMVEVEKNTQLVNNFGSKVKNKKKKKTEDHMSMPVSTAQISIPTLPSKTLASSSTEVHDILRSNSDATDDTEKTVEVEKNTQLVNNSGSKVKNKKKKKPEDHMSMPVSTAQISIPTHKSKPARSLSENDRSTSSSATEINNQRIFVGGSPRKDLDSRLGDNSKLFGIINDHQFLCTICNCQISSIQNTVSHADGKQHKKVLENYEKCKTESLTKNKSFGIDKDKEMLQGCNGQETIDFPTEDVPVKHLQV